VSRLSVRFELFSVVNCTVLSVGHLVKTSPDSCLTSQMKFNTTCSFSCPKGYQLQGPSYKHCGANGQWTDSAKSVSCKGETKITGVSEKTATTVLVLFILITIAMAFLDNNECTVSNGGCSHKCVKRPFKNIF